jgi:hypothetical protein
MKKYKTPKEYKEIKLAKNRKASDVFDFLLRQGVIEPYVSKATKRAEIKAALPAIPTHKQKRITEGDLARATLQRFKQEIQAELAPVSKTSRKQRRQEHREDMAKIMREKYPPEELAFLTKKQLRKKYKHRMTDSEWYFFCRHAKSCRRGNREFKRRQASKSNNTGQTSTRLAYNNFINSPIWQGIKNKYWQTHARKCAACNSSKFIHLHHMVYGQFGEEQEDDLIPLCKTHHDQYHSENGTERNMKSKTMEFIERIKSGGAPIERTSSAINSLRSVLQDAA